MTDISILTQQYEAFVNMRELDYIFGLEVISDNEALRNMSLSNNLREIVNPSVFLQNEEDKTENKKVKRSRPRALKRLTFKKTTSNFDALYKVDPAIFYKSVNC